MSAKLPNKKRARRSRNKPTISWCDPDTMSPVLRSTSRARGQAPRLVALLWRRKAVGIEAAGNDGHGGALKPYFRRRSGAVAVSAPV
jgi:hypothetical protein